MEQTQQIKTETPPRDVVAMFVKLARGLAGWKKATLASMANVSLSTVERVERGEPVSTESLDRLAVALKQPAGAFTSPRVQRSEEEALAAVIDQWAWMGEVKPVDVEPLRKQSQLRLLSDTVFAVLDHDLDDADDDVAALREWMGLLSFVRAEYEGLIGTNLPRENNLRRLYQDILTFVADIERRHRCVCLVGVYQPETTLKMFQGSSVAVVALKSKVKNPAAAARRTLFAPAKMDFKEALERAFAEDGEQ
jgi:transcriptional regulator with XRE-family HTH domain